MKIHLSLDRETSNAVGALAKLQRMDSRTLLDNLREPNVESVVLSGKEVPRYGDSLMRNLYESYWKAWGAGEGRLLGATYMNPRTVVANNVYRVVKKLVLKNSYQGIITGSTLQSIDTWRAGDTLVGGIRGGSWPNTTARTFRASVSEVITELDKIYQRRNDSMMNALFGNTVEKSMIAADRMVSWQKMKRVTREGLAEKEAKIGTIKVEWDSTGLRIIWPYKVRQVTGLENWLYKSEPFLNKVYKGNRQERLFEFQPWFFKFVEDTFHAWVQFMWDPTVKAEGRGGTTSTMGDQPTQKTGTFDVTAESLFGNPEFDQEKYPVNWTEELDKPGKVGRVRDASEAESWEELAKDQLKDYKGDYGPKAKLYQPTEDTAEGVKGTWVTGLGPKTKGKGVMPEIHEVEEEVYEAVEKTKIQAMLTTEEFQMRYLAMMNPDVARLVQWKAATQANKKVFDR